MPETIGKTPDQVIRVEIGKPFKPFEMLTKLPLPDDSPEFFDDVYVTTSAKFELQGMEIYLGLIPTGTGFKPIDYDDAFYTPLGGAQEEITLENNDFKITKIPLKIALLSTMDRRQFNIAREYQLQIKMGDKTYYVLCPEDVLFDDADTDDNKWENRKNNFINDRLIDENGDLVQVLLPYDPEKLSTIEVTITKLPEKQPTAE